jgi:uncharacterized protein (DUF1919 family)
MSLTSNLRQKTPIGRLLIEAAISPSFTTSDMLVEHKANRWSLIGTAFDYRVRMGIALSKKIDFVPGISDIAFIEKSGYGNLYVGYDDFEFIENFAAYMSMDFVALETLAKSYHEGMVPDGDDSALSMAWNARTLLQDIATRWKEYMDKDGHYIDLRQTVIQQIQDGADNIDLSKAALKFANWDPYMRAGYYNPDWDKVEQADAEEIEALYKVWQEKFVLNDGDIQMNPAFGDSSRLVGGADADLIVGTTLIDWKVINKPRTGLKENMAQLLGYAALAHLEGQTIEHVALYFGRHGQTVTVKIEDLTDIPLATIAASIKKLSLEASL